MPVDVNQLKQRIAEVLGAKAELKRLTSKPFVELNLETKYAIRYHVIVLAEALGSICLHIATEEFSQTPFSYSECFTFLDEQGVCSDCAKDLRPLVRLRNLLAHHYWVIDDERVYNSIKNDFRGVDKFLEIVGDKYGNGL